MKLDRVNKDERRVPLEDGTQEDQKRELEAACLLIVVSVLGCVALVALIVKCWV